MRSSDWSSDVCSSDLASPKGSTGRLDVFTRLIVDRAAGFEQVPGGYSGPMYLEIAPRTFSIVVRAGDRLNQIRFRVGAPGTSDRQDRRASCRERGCQNV